MGHRMEKNRLRHGAPGGTAWPTVTTKYRTGRAVRYTFARDLVRSEIATPTRRYWHCARVQAEPEETHDEAK